MKIYLVLTTDDRDYDGAVVYTNRDEAQREADKINRHREYRHVEGRAYVQELTVKA